MGRGFLDGLTDDDCLAFVIFSCSAGFKILRKNGQLNVLNFNTRVGRRIANPAERGLTDDDCCLFFVIFICSAGFKILRKKAQLKVLNFNARVGRRIANPAGRGRKYTPLICRFNFFVSSPDALSLFLNGT